MGDMPPNGIPMGLDCTIPRPRPGAARGTPIPGMPMPAPGGTMPRVGGGGMWPSMGLGGGTGLVRSWLRPNEEG